MGEGAQIVLAGLAIIGPLLLLLWFANVVSEYRHLRNAGFPRPGLIVARRSLRFLPATAPRLEDPAGRMAWLSWDLRWLAVLPGHVVDTGHP